ncbi:MAG: DUF1501 domain-containing protein [Planctomycetaceae bacterium]|nr:DUF1501 domain-containing protein [Planctomycetaceae bacterium]
MLGNTFEQSRRQFLTSSASGLGACAAFDLLSRDSATANEPPHSLTGRPPHFLGRAKQCIFVYAAGGPSQFELFDPKPLLNERNGESLPESFTKNVRFAFIKKDAKLLGSRRNFAPRGQCGTELSDLLPHLSNCVDDIALVRSMHTEAFNHHPAQLMLSTGVPRFGRPSFGSWVLYGLGNESQQLPGYIVLTAGRGASGGTSNWTNGFLPSTYQGVVLRNKGEPVLNLNNPPGVSREVQAASLKAIRSLNQRQQDRLGDDEIASRIASYELAFRMQMAAPDVLDLSDETQSTLQAYGVDRSEPTDVKSSIGGGPGVYQSFARNCVLARRLVERGVRFVTLMHASWDQHGSLHSALEYNARMADQPLAALLQDLKARGLLDSTLVVFAGEFGRTPLAQGTDGRDHHPNAFSAWMAGGGIRGGQVVGKTDEFGWNPIEDPVHINDFHATLLHLFGFDHTRLSKTFGGLDLRLTNVGGHVVDQLIA